MEKIFASLERQKELWLELEDAVPKSSTAEALMKQIVLESHKYMGLIEQDHLPRRKPRKP